MYVHVDGLLVDSLVLMKQSIIGPDQTCFQGVFALHEMRYCLQNC